MLSLNTNTDDVYVEADDEYESEDRKLRELYEQAKSLQEVPLCSDEITPTPYNFRTTASNCESRFGIADAFKLPTFKEYQKEYLKNTDKLSFSGVGHKSKLDTFTPSSEIRVDFKAKPYIQFKQSNCQRLNQLALIEEPTTDLPVTELPDNKHYSRRQVKAIRKAERETTAGANWYHMPKSELTDELKADLKMLQLRGATDPKQFYKRPDYKKNKFPGFLQKGRVLDNPIDFYSSRMPRAQRKRTLVEELLADNNMRSGMKRRLKEINDKHRNTAHRRKKAFKHAINKKRKH